MENFANISVKKPNLDHDFKNIFCDFLNYISHCVYLLSKASKQTVVVVCTVK